MLILILDYNKTDMMELADMLDLGSSEETLEGSSPSIRKIAYVFIYAFVNTRFLLLTFI